MNGKIEFQSLIRDISDNPHLRSLKDYPGHKFFNNNGGRLKHSYSVAWLSYRLAMRLNLDQAIAARAGLLHDIGYVHEEAPFPNILRHASRGARRARELGENGEVCEIISRHAWLVWTADKAASVLEFLGLEKLMR